jgi:hypothetical protein
MGSSAILLMSLLMLEKSPWRRTTNISQVTVVGAAFVNDQEHPQSSARTLQRVRADPNSSLDAVRCQ